jgi:hypothetical protein
MSKERFITLWYDKIMKTTRYFDYMRQRPDRAWIKMEWIETAITNPDTHEIQSDGRHRFWKRIDEAEGRFLRVITLEDGETVHNAFFDRRFKG